MINNDLPIVDWELALTLAGDQQELAKDILAAVLKNLPEDLALFQQQCQEQQFADLQRSVHKLHGALCYCGLPRLKTIIHTLETELKNNNVDNLHPHLIQFEKEVQLLLEHASHLSL